MPAKQEANLGYEEVEIEDNKMEIDFSDFKILHNRLVKKTERKLLSFHSVKEEAEELRGDDQIVIYFDDGEGSIGYKHYKKDPMGFNGNGLRLVLEKSFENKSENKSEEEKILDYDDFIINWLIFRL